MPAGVMGFVAMTLAALAVGYLAFVIGLDVSRSRQSASRRLMGLQAEPDVMDRTLTDRLFVPALQALGRAGMRLTPSAWGQRTRTRLIRAGWHPDIDEVSWAAVRVIAIVSAAVVFFLLSRITSGLSEILLFVLFALLGIAGPDQLLNRRAEERVRAIESDLPDIIDLLVISIEAGLGFEAALDRVVRHVPGPLSDEFSRMLQETRVGVSRYEAMRNLAARTDVDDLNSFVLAMNQADTFGVSIGRMLRVQAEEMRNRRRFRAQERAFGAPVKMVFPLALCILPAIFVVLLVPALINVLQNLNF